MGIFTPPNMIITFANIIFFIVVQTLFFKFVASKQFNNVLGNKVGIFNTYVKYNPQFKAAVEEFLGSDQVKAIEEAAKTQEKERNAANNDLIKSWIGIPLVVAVVILLIFIWLLFKQSTDSGNAWSSIDTAILTLVVGAYATELMFFFGIVRRYEFYGDQQIYSRLYDGIHNNINRKPLTKAGQKLNDDIMMVVDAKMTMTDLMEKHKDLAKNLVPDSSRLLNKIKKGVRLAKNNPEELQKALAKTLVKNTSQDDRAFAQQVANDTQQFLDQFKRL